MLELFSKLFGTTTPVVYSSSPVMGRPRSPKWPALARKIVKERQKCAATGTTTDLEVHHILPFHLYPEHELDESNLIVLYRGVHFLLGHLGDWSSWNPEIVKDAAALLAKVQARPKGFR